MKVVFATDHAGFALKEHLKNFVASLGHEVIDMGAMEDNPEDDYPDLITPAAEAVARGEREGEDIRGIVLGGSGQGEAIVANRIRGIRAAVCYGIEGKAEEIVRLSREHNNANVLSLGARFLTNDESEKIVHIWLATPFSLDERHVRRIEKLDI